MKNESTLVSTVKSNLPEKEFKEDFMVSHFFTQYKIHSAEYFLKKLEEMEKKPNGIFSDRDKARICIDCFCYELYSIYDGIHNEINSAFQFGYKNSYGFRKNVQKKMKSRKSVAMNKIDSAWNSWIKKFKDERNDYTHIKIRGQHIHYEIGKPIEIYDRYDMLEPNKKTLVKKLGSDPLVS